MLTVILTLLFALYVLGPDLMFRWVVGWSAPARYRKKTYGEQITGACLLCCIPDLLVWESVRHLQDVYSPAHKNLLVDFFDATVSQSFEAHSAGFYKSLPFVWKLNLLCLIGVYAAIIALALVFGLLLRRYGRLLRHCEKHKRYALRDLVSSLVRPWTAEWHLRLSPMLLPDGNTYIQADILTTMDVLYRGNLIEHHLSNEGALVSVTIEEARKFKRLELLADREKFETTGATKGVGKRSKKSAPNPEEYWNPVGGRFFVVRADEIVTLNIRYVEKQKPKLPPEEILLQVLQELQALRAPKPQVTLPQASTMRPISSPFTVVTENAARKKAEAPKSAPSKSTSRSRQKPSA